MSTLLSLWSARRGRRTRVRQRRRSVVRCQRA